MSRSILLPLNRNLATPTFPPGLPDAPRHTRRRSGSFSYHSGCTYASGDEKLGKRPFSRMPYAQLAPPPPPPPSAQTYRGSIKFDPFGCSDDLPPSPPAASTSYPWKYDPSTNDSKLLFPTQPIVVKIPSAVMRPKPPVPDRNARSRVVAGILLNRIHAVGKPMRRGLNCYMERQYVKSGLSQHVVTGESD